MAHIEGAEMRASRNPWLEIPLADYERHMSAPAVAQAEMLADVLRGLAERYRPRSLAVLGTAGGNGLDGIDPRVTERVVAVDIHPEYLETCGARHAARFAEFEPVHCDLNMGAPFAEPVELVYAALILESLDVDAFLDYTPGLVTEGGRIAFVFQEPHAHGAITDSGVTSLQALKNAHATVDVAAVVDDLMAQGMSLGERRSMVAAGGKSFTLLTMQQRKNVATSR